MTLQVRARMARWWARSSSAECKPSECPAPWKDWIAIAFSTAPSKLAALCIDKNLAIFSPVSGYSGPISD